MENEHFLGLWYDQLDEANERADRAEAKAKKAIAEAEKANEEKANAVNKVAINLLKMRMPMKDICEATNLSIPVLTQLANNNNISI